VGWIDQDARASLDPLRTVQAQVEEAAGLAGRTGEQAGAAAWLRQAGFPDPGAVLRLWPHQLSGGMAQRVAIARALARGSRFLLADECTSGLDAVIVEELLTELRRLRAAGFGVLLVTHDLRLARRVADRVILLHEGRTVEQADAPERLTGVGRELWAATCRVGPGIAAPGGIA
jgi:peptide/nickel transport system ATP-binding protein